MFVSLFLFLSVWLSLMSIGGDYQDRPSCQRFEQWVLSAGKKIRGSKKKEKGSKRRISQVTDSPIKSKITNPQSINIFSEIFSEEDDSIWPLQLVDLRDKEQFGVLYPLLSKLPHTVMYYLGELIFPEVLAHQNLKLSTCGQVTTRTQYYRLPIHILPSYCSFFSSMVLCL